MSIDEEAVKLAPAMADAGHNRPADPSYTATGTVPVESAPPDEALMVAYQGGEVRAFETLFGRYQDRVFGYFVRYFGDRELAADLFQRTFLHVHRARAEYEPSRSFAAWVFGIASNLGKDELKRRSRRPGDAKWATPDDAPVGVAEGDDPETRLISQERAVRVEGALAKLPASQREVVILHKLEGLSFREIAQALGEEVEAVKSRAFRGYRALRKLLDEGETA